MNIQNFKEGDIITRVAPSTRSKEHGDRSYQGDKFEFVGVDKGMIVLIGLDRYNENTIVKVETDWFSENWDYYPQGLIDKAKARLKALAASKNEPTQ